MSKVVKPNGSYDTDFSFQNKLETVWIFFHSCKLCKSADIVCIFPVPQSRQRQGKKRGGKGNELRGERDKHFIDYVSPWNCRARRRWGGVCQSGRICGGFCRPLQRVPDGWQVINIDVHSRVPWACTTHHLTMRQDQSQRPASSGSRSSGVFCPVTGRIALIVAPSPTRWRWWMSLFPPALLLFFWMPPAQSGRLMIALNNLLISLRRTRLLFEWMCCPI